MRVGNTLTPGPKRRLLRLSAGRIHSASRVGDFRDTQRYWNWIRQDWHRFDALRIEHSWRGAYAPYVRA